MLCGWTLTRRVGGYPLVGLFARQFQTCELDQHKIQGRLEMRTYQGQTCLIKDISDQCAGLGSSIPCQTSLATRRSSRPNVLCGSAPSTGLRIEGHGFQWCPGSRIIDENVCTLAQLKREYTIEKRSFAETLRCDMSEFKRRNTQRNQYQKPKIEIRM
ncbi:hypothetical protein TNCV_2777431 [Trichonephila clavipes]|nr:hypothetical protein TNCV_2777431 [Trichonephila clavipes]